MQIGQQGWSQQTPAVKAILSSGVGSSRASRKRATRSTKSSRKSIKRRVKRASKRVSSGLKRLVKGSAAAKAYMAKIRRKRKK